MFKNPKASGRSDEDEDEGKKPGFRSHFLNPFSKKDGKDKRDKSPGLKPASSPQSGTPARVSVNEQQSSPPKSYHQSIIRANEVLKESTTSLRDTCKASKLVKNMSLKISDDWLLNYLQTGRDMNTIARRDEWEDRDPPKMTFEAALVRVIDSKDAANQRSVAGHIAKTWGKIYPIADVALAVVESAVESLEFPGVKFAFQAITVIFTVIGKVSKDGERVRETLENFVDYSSTIISIREARLDLSLSPNIAISKNTILLYAKLLDFLKSSLQFFEESAFISGIKSAFDTSPIATNQEALVNAYVNLGHSLDHAYTAMRLRRQRLKNDESFLDAISKLNFEATHEQIDSEFVEGTGQSVLDSKTFQKWLKKERLAASVLFAYGTGQCPNLKVSEWSLKCLRLVGAGKTFVTARVIDHLTSENFQSRTDYTLVAYMYCNRRLQKEQTPTGLIRNIIRQLVEHMLLKGLDYNARDLVDQKFPKGSYSFQAYVDFLRSLLGILPSSSRQPILVIDAINELLTNKLGANNRQPLLDALLSLPVRIFLTGNEDMGQDTLANAAKVYRMRIGPVRSDVSRYIRYQIANSGQLKDYSTDDDTPNKDVDRITVSLWGKYSDNFSLISMQMARIVTASTIKRMRDIAEKDPKWSSNEMFKAALGRILSGTEDSISQARKIMAWILFTPENRSLNFIEVQHALAFEIGSPVPLPDDDGNQNSESEIVAYCAGFVAIEPVEKTITFAHNQVRSFLRDKEILKLLFGDFNTRDYMTQSCLEYLCDEKVYKAQPLKVRFIDRKILKDYHKDRDAKYPFAKYAEEFWAIHAKGESEESQQKLILQYLDKGPPYLNSDWLIPNLEWSKSYQNPIPRFMTKDSYPLFSATRNNLENTLKALQARGENVNAVDNFGWTILHTVVAEGHLDVLMSLCKLWPDEIKAMVPKIDDKGYTPLHIACNEGHDDVALMLLELGADIFAVGKDGNAVYYAVVSSLEKTVEKMLRMEPDSVNMHLGLRRGETALHIAANMDNQVIVKLLLNHKADVSIQDKDENFAFAYSKDPVIHDLLADAAYELLRSLSGKGKEIASAS